MLQVALVSDLTPSVFLPDHGSFSVAFLKHTWATAWDIAVGKKVSASCQIFQGTHHYFYRGFNFEATQMNFKKEIDCLILYNNNF